MEYLEDMSINREVCINDKEDISYLNSLEKRAVSMEFQIQDISRSEALSVMQAVPSVL